MMKLFAPSPILKICIGHEFGRAPRCNHVAKIVGYQKYILFYL